MKNSKNKNDATKPQAPAFTVNSKILTISELINYIETNKNSFEIVKNKSIYYYNVPFAFDIETTSFYEKEEKRAIMYAFTFGCNGYSTICRTWDEFLFIINKISEILDLKTNYKHILIYVHNLGYEFQFIKNLFTWVKVFAIEERKPIYCINNRGIEFRCSYLLSGYALKNVGEHLNKYHVEKMSGDLDYTLIRHSKTPLTEKEEKYILNDGLVVMAYIEELIEEYKSITKIPLTKTGFVRNYCRNQCLYGGESSHKKYNLPYKEYHKQMLNLSITSLTMYMQLKQCFQGGFTHCNAFYNNKILENVTSFDFTSSYPACMIAEKYPMSNAEIITIKDSKDFYNNLNCYCCMFDAIFENIDATFIFEHYISISKCRNIKKAVTDNGRIVSAEKIEITLTELDFKIIEKTYTWEHLKVKNFRRFIKNYLPTAFIKSILKLYKDKTELKGVKGKENDYLRSKEMLNSCYGMTVTDILRKNITYNSNSNEWETKDVDAEETLKKYNINKTRFLYYAWGIWVTAYARFNLWLGVLNCNEDYIYSDTDSIKILNSEKHIEFINNYNKYITDKIQKALTYHKLDLNMAKPKTILDVEKPLGVWDYDGHYKHFKTLGAKRYMVEYDNGDFSMTVSGVNKFVAIPYLINTYKNPFKAFHDGLKIPRDYTGKNTHTYLDYEQNGKIKDYLNNVCNYHELSSVHMEKAEYNLSISDDYLDYLLNIRERN